MVDIASSNAINRVTISDSVFSLNILDAPNCRVGSTILYSSNMLQCVYNDGRDIPESLDISVLEWSPTVSNNVSNILNVVGLSNILRNILKHCIICTTKMFAQMADYFMVSAVNNSSSVVLTYGVKSSSKILSISLANVMSLLRSGLLPDCNRSRLSGRRTT